MYMIRLIRASIRVSNYYPRLCASRLRNAHITTYELYRFVRPQTHFLSSRYFSRTPTLWVSNENKKPSFKKDPKGWFKALPGIIWDGLVNIWIGSKLLGLNISTTCGLLYRLAKGHKLTRREYRLLVTTVSDIFRMVPFSFFIIVPMAEFLLPLALRIFPNIIPSTYTTPAQYEEKLKRKLKARIEMAKFVIETAQHAHESSPKFKLNFEEFMESLKKGQTGVVQDDVYKFVSKFKDDVTLDNLKRSQIQAMCKFLDIIPYGPTQLLRFQLRNRVNQLKVDDKMIRDEGVQSLSLIELKQACAVRGMSSIGSRTTLEDLMEEWLDLSLNLKVPTALLILSRAFRLLSMNQTSEELIIRSIQHMPENVIDEVDTEVELTKNDDLRAKLQILKEEREKVQKEMEMKQQEHDKTTELVGSVEQLRPEEIKASQLGDFLSEMATPCEGEIHEFLKVELDLKELQREGKKNPELDKSILVVTKLVNSLQDDVSSAEVEGKRLLDLDKDGRLTCDELRQALSMAGIQEDDISDFISRIDTDHDGYVDLEHVKKLRNFDITVDSLKENITSVDDEGAKKRAALHKKIHQFHKEAMKKDIIP